MQGGDLALQRMFISATRSLSFSARAKRIKVILRDLLKRFRHYQTTLRANIPSRNASDRFQLFEYDDKKCRALFTIAHWERIIIRHDDGT